MLDEFVSFYETKHPNDVREALRIFKRHRINRFHKYTAIKLTVDTVGIATELKCSCNNEHFFVTKRKQIKWQDKTRKNAGVKFASNVLFCLALQLIGGARSEADTILSYLNHPHGSSIKNRMLTVENKLGHVIRDIGSEQMRAALEEEILEQLIEESREEDFVKWKRGEKIRRVFLTVSFDMGWNKRSTGTRYDSNTGHALLVGARLKKIVAMRVFSKDCAICKSCQKTNKPLQTHDCPKNYTGSSKSMEVEAIFQLVLEAWENNWAVGVIVSDDDTTMKSHLTHGYKDLIAAGKMRPEDWPRTQKGNKKSCHGRLPLHITPPSFQADPNHRVKVVGKTIYEFAKMPQKQSQIDKALALRIKEYWGAMIKQVRKLNWDKDEKVIMSRVKAPIEHIFNNHKHCDIAWCYVLQARRDNKP